MNKPSLLALLGLPLTTATVVYNELDDPRCHVDPHHPVLEPTPGPSPLPPPPGQMRVFTDPPTVAPVCPGMVKGFQIVDLADSTAAPIPVVDGSTITLTDLPDTFTIEAITEGSPSEVKFFVDGSDFHTDHTSPFTFSGGEFSDLYVKGSYSLSAYAKVGGGSWDDECAVSVTVVYGNKNVCEGLVSKFALFDTLEQAIVPGYEVLGDGQDLDLADLPDHLSIIASPNGFGSDDEIEFYLDDTLMTTVTGAPHAITGNAGGTVPEWTQLRETGSYTISAKMKNRLGTLESEECRITVHVDSDWICEHEIVGYSLINTETNEVVPGYAHMTGARVIDLAEVPEFLSLRINKKSSVKRGVKIYLNSRGYRNENWPPYALNGDRSGDYHASDLLTTPGIYHFMTRGRKDNNKWESRGNGCELSLTVTDSSTPKVSNPPETILRVIDNDDGPCAPKLVTPITAGNHMYMNTPVKVESIDTDRTVSFKVFNYIKEDAMDWITTAFVTPSGVEVCDKVDNVAFEDFTEHIYEAKCVDGFAYADVFAYSTTFSTAQASADTSMLPDACKNDFDGQVVRYTFVFSCNCEETPEIPDEIVGGVPTEEITCAGSVGNSWGDPHIVPYDGGQYDCQGTGEFVLTKATLTDYPFDFEAQVRYWRFNMKGISFSWTTGVAIQQDVKVQLTISESVLPYSTMFADLPVNMYIDGVPRLMTQGSGDHRVIVTVDGFNVSIFFATTGISVTVYIRPDSVSRHIRRIPGSLTVYTCLPDDNPSITDVMGLLGTPNQDRADDWMDTSGTTISRGSMSAFDYCTNTWCIRDQNESLFVYDAGYDFSYYEKCDDGHRTRHLEAATPSPEIQDVCSGLDDNHIEGTEACLFDGAHGGREGAEVAVEAMEHLEAQRKAALLSKTESEDACCSRDFKTCEPACGPNKHLCSTCEEGDTFTWLNLGPFDDPEDNGDCVAKGETCSATLKCCPNMECSAGACVPIETISSARRLQEFVFERPDLSDERNIIPLSDL